MFNVGIANDKSLTKQGTWLLSASDIRRQEQQLCDARVMSGGAGDIYIDNI